MTLIRCFLPEILSEEKVLWLDVDTLVFKPIDDLWNKDIDGFAIMGWSEPVHQIKRKICFGYVNAGVLLMNLKFMRKIKATEKMVQLLNETFYPFADQDVLNIVCEGYIGYISYEYNWGPIAFKKDRELTPKIFHATFRKLWDGHRPDLWKQYYKEKL